MNKIMPQRTFSPRSFMGDRGISIDSYGRVLKNDLFDDGKTGNIVAPKPWKPSHSKSLSNSKPFVDENLFEEAGQEIQTIILHTLNMFEADSESADHQFFSNMNININQSFSNNNTLIAKPMPKLNNSNNNLNIFSKKNLVNDNINISNNNINNNNNNNNSNGNRNTTTSAINNSNYSNISSDNNISDSFTSISQTIGNIIENYTQEPLIELKIPFFSHSPCFSTDLEPIPLTPPTRTHNPITLNQAFAIDQGADPQQGVELGLLSISPPPFSTK